MMNNNKILTVSYGTFSCTLEGFEDSFGTMKAIAEYFRDLAADDRYFGAEPPQPDAEMLARIAEKEVARRVEARQQDGQIVLSAIPSEAATETPAQPIVSLVPEAPKPAEEAAAEPEIEAEADGDAADTAPLLQTVSNFPAEVQTADSAEEDSDADAEAEDDLAEEEGGDAAMIAAIGSITEQAETAETTEAEPVDIVPGQPDAEIEAFFDGDADIADAGVAEVDEDAADFFEDEAEIAEIDEDEVDDVEFHGDEAEVALGDEAAIEDDDVNESTPLHALADIADVDEAPAETAPLHAIEEVAFEAEEVEVTQAPADNSIAAKLQRIRAVVSRRTVPQEEAFLEDEHAETEETGTDTSDLIAEARADIEDALQVDDASDAASISDPEDEEEDALSALLSRVNAGSTSHVTDHAPAQADAAEDDEDTLEVDESEDEVADSVSNLFEDDAEDDVARAMEQPKARVIKVKRADLEAAIEQGDLEEVAEDEDDALSALDALAPSKQPETTLSAEEEEDLARELSDLKADIEAERDETPEADMDEVAEAEEAEESVEAAKPSGRSRLPALDDDENGDVDRLLTETDHQMDEPESATRRDAFAHLRAAVAAKKADTTIDDDAASGKGFGVYREDLAEVVRPRRPVSTEARTERPEEPRPAPLKLVAEQRIDVEQPASRGPVRPRRVAAPVDAQPVETSEGFSEFAEEMGATTLPDLLEAAAAYLSFVEGREQFSRPQLMTKVRQAGGQDGFSREEGLRHFGQLLRKGKIEKIKGGRFTVSDDIGFRPDERAAS